MTFDEWYSMQKHQLTNEQVCRLIWDRAQKEEREACLNIAGHRICGSQGFAGPSRCILPIGHSGPHKYGIPVTVSAAEIYRAIKERGNETP